MDAELAMLAERYAAVIGRIARAHHVRYRTAQRWFCEMVRFLDLVDALDDVLAPSKKFDRAWHQFILFTQEYEEFCEWRYGGFVHHHPSEEKDGEAYARTYDAYERHFGRPDGRVWRNPFAGGGGGCGGVGCGGGG